MCRGPISLGSPPCLGPAAPCAAGPFPSPLPRACAAPRCPLPSPQPLPPLLPLPTRGPALRSASGALASLPAHAGALPLPVSPAPAADWRRRRRRRPGLAASVAPGPPLLRAAAARDMAAASCSSAPAPPAGPGPGPGSGSGSGSGSGPAPASSSSLSSSSGPGPCEWLLLRDGCLRCDAEGLRSLCYHPALNAILAVTARGAIKVIDGTSGATLQASALNGERGARGGRLKGGGGGGAVLCGCHRWSRSPEGPSSSVPHPLTSCGTEFFKSRIHPKVT